MDFVKKIKIITLLLHFDSPWGRKRRSRLYTISETQGKIHRNLTPLEPSEKLQISKD